MKDKKKSLIERLIPLQAAYDYWMRAVSTEMEDKVDQVRIQQEIDEVHNVMQQRFEDAKMEMYIKQCALDRYSQWITIKDNDVLRTGMCLVRSPYSGGIYYLYHEKTAKYHKVDINNAIEEEFNKLREGNGL